MLKWIQCFAISAFMLGVLFACNCLQAAVFLEDLHHQAEVFKQKGEYSKAITIFQKLTQSDPKQLDWKVELCHLYRWNKQSEKSKLCFDEVLAQYSQHQDALMGKAYLASDAGNMDEAKLQLSQVLAQNPKNQEALELSKSLEKKQEEISQAAAASATPFDAPNSQLSGVPGTDKNWRIDVGGGAQTFNFFDTSSTVFTQVYYQKPKKFFLVGRFDYLNKFADKSYTGTLGGGYWVHPKILLSDTMSVAPSAYVSPEFQNTFEISGILPKGFNPYLRYNYRHYQIADVNMLTPGISWYFTSWGIVDFNYTLAINSFKSFQGGTYDNSFATRFTFIPIEDRFKLFVGYARTEESFDAGNTLQFGKFHANVVSGGFEWVMFRDIGLRFDTAYENRDNGQTLHSYISSLFYQF